MPENKWNNELEKFKIRLLHYIVLPTIAVLVAMFVLFLVRFLFEDLLEIFSVALGAISVAVTVLFAYKSKNDVDESIAKLDSISAAMSRLEPRLHEIAVIASPHSLKHSVTPEPDIIPQQPPRGDEIEAAEKKDDC